MAKKEGDKITTTHETHSLKCMLTNEELLQKGDDLARALDELRKVQEEKQMQMDFDKEEAA